MSWDRNTWLKCQLATETACKSSLFYDFLSLFPPLIAVVVSQGEGPEVDWGGAGWTGFQCWTTNISHQPPCAENPRTELCTLLSARHKLGGDSWTVGTAPPTRRTSSFSVTTLETWRSADAPPSSSSISEKLEFCPRWARDRSESEVDAGCRVVLPVWSDTQEFELWTLYPWG